MNKEPRSWVNHKWLVFFKKVKMPSEKRKKIDGKMYRGSNLNECPYKKSLFKNLMKARRDVVTALKKKDKTLERKARNRVHKYKKKLGER